VRVIHVTPINDEMEHLDSADCWCEPTIDWSHAEAICTHNAADCRELIEQAEKIKDETIS
jgi:hypothetical protein